MTRSAPPVCAGSRRSSADPAEKSRRSGCWVPRRRSPRRGGQRCPPRPRPLTALIGREEELEEVTALLNSSPLVTLIGGGGVGKTRLALQVATGLEARYPGRVLFVELAALADPALLPAFVAAALGLHEEGGAPSQEPTQARTRLPSQ